MLDGRNAHCTAVSVYRYMWVPRVGTCRALQGYVQPMTLGLGGRGRRGPALGGTGCRNFAFSTTRAPVRLFLPSKLSHPLIYEWVGPNRGAEGVKHTLSSLGSAPQAQEGPTPRPRMRPRCSHSEADRTACSQAVRPAVAFACGIRSSRWLRCFSQSPVARGRRAR